MTTTITRPADRLRAALKQAGFNTRRVSVRAEHSTLQVTIRDRIGITDAGRSHCRSVRVHSPL